MSLPKPTLLLTRPEAASRRFIGQLDPVIMAQVEVVISPLIRIACRTDPISFEGIRGLIFSSANGVLSAKSVTDRRDLPCFCVGLATTRAARQAGWTAHQAGQDADTLVAALCRDKPDAPLLHLRGEHGRGNVAQRLTERGLITREQVIYEQLAEPLTPEAQKALQGSGPVIAPLFSPRTAQLFAAQTPRRAVTVAALSAAVAQEVAGNASIRAHVAAQPDAQAMGQLVEKLLQSTLAG